LREKRCRDVAVVRANDQHRVLGINARHSKLVSRWAVGKARYGALCRLASRFCQRRGGAVESVLLVESDYDVPRVGFKQPLCMMDCSQTAIRAANTKLQAMLLENLRDRLVVRHHAHVNRQLGRNGLASRSVAPFVSWKPHESAREQAISLLCE